MTARISVVVPFKNSERYISRCIDGLLAQSYPRDRYEIVMIDNNSRDASADIVRRHSGVTLISEAKRGVYAARNRGIREARGDIIAFTDADCVPDSDWIAELESALGDPQTGIVIGSHAFADDSPLLAMLADYENWKKAYIFESQRGHQYYGHTNNMAVRRALLEEQGGFAEALRGADTVFVQRCAQRRSAAVARYHAAARVRHLEIDSVWCYLRKVFIYGRSSRRFPPHVTAQPLANGDRYRILAAIVRSRRYSLARSAGLAMALLVGMAFWCSGRISLVMSRSPAPRHALSPLAVVESAKQPDSLTRPEKPW
jgi:glycosyltransferase involved in cell wall biosynthesis